MTLDNNQDYQTHYDDLLTILAAPQSAFVDLQCSGGDAVWIEYVQALPDGTFVGNLYNNVCGETINTAVYFTKENIYSALCCSRPTGR